MNQLRCIAIDDEPIALSQMTANIAKTPFLTLAGAFDNAIGAMSFLQSNEADLLFVDINMPDLNGIDFIRSLPDCPAVIFTTAYSTYAVEGFKLDAVDYLLKPISYPEFLKSANKALLRHEQSRKTSADVKAEGRFLFFNTGSKYVRVDCHEITYIEGLREYVKIHLDGKKSIVTLQSMKNLAECLPPDLFMQIHRSYIVNLSKIKEVERNRIFMGDNDYIPLSKLFKPAFQAYLNNNILH